MYAGVGGCCYRYSKEDSRKPTVTRIRILVELLQPDVLTKLLQIIKIAL